jgi:hypothetical protein
MGASSEEREEEYDGCGIKAEVDESFDVKGGINEDDDLAIDEATSPDTAAATHVTAGGGTVTSTSTEVSNNKSGSATTQDGGLQQCGISASSHPRSCLNTPVNNSSGGGKTKNSSNRNCASVGRLIQNLTDAMTTRITSGANSGESGGMMTMQIQMMQQSQMQI